MKWTMNWLNFHLQINHKIMKQRQICYYNVGNFAVYEIIYKPNPDKL